MKVSVVGAGPVGLVTAAGLASLGHEVACFDSDPLRATAAARGEPLFHEPDLADRLRAALDRGTFRVAETLEAAIHASAVSILAVGTPFGVDSIDLRALEAAASAVGRALATHPGEHVVAVKSTVVPGTTDGVVRSALEAASGRSLGAFGLAVNPEFLREGSAMADFLAPDRIVIGHSDQRSAEVLAELHRPFSCPKVFTTLRNAEMIKYASNALLATLVSFSNEIAVLCETLPGLDESVVMRGVHLDRRLTPPGPGAPAPGILAYLRAGVGFGGSCLPKDVDALRALARALGTPTPLLDAVMTVNRERCRQVEALLKTLLGPLEGRSLALLGLAFKPGTDDVRDSPALALARRLSAAGASLRAWDPMVRDLVDGPPALVVCGDIRTALAGAEAAVIATACPELRTLDWRDVTHGMRRPVVLDGRGVLDGVQLPPEIIRLRIGVAP